MNAQSIREQAHKAPRKLADVDTSFWPGTNGKVAIGDVPMDELLGLQSLMETDKAAYSAAIICRVLVDKETGKCVFPDGDRDWIKSQTTVILELMPKITIFFGLK